MEFPHLSDTRFPYLERENAYAFQNTFDYTRWTEHTRVKLVNVLWDATYNDVVDFKSDELRDAWFDSLEGTSITLESAARIVPEGYVKIPLPYDVATRYNYVCVDIPIATGEDSMIQFERESGMRRWYFFIDAIEYGSPNCTHAYLTPDAWTNFHNSMSIRFMMLERGHAPVAATDTDTYLSNPLMNSELLLSPDVDFGRGSIVRESGMIPFGNGDKMVVFASMATRYDLLVMGSRTGSGTDAWSRPTYASEGGRDGHDVVVNGYVWGDGYDYSELRTRVTNGASNLDRLANNVTCWCIPASDCFGFRGEDYDKSFLVRMGRECPAFMQTVLAMFVVDSDMIDFNYEPVKMCGYELRYCRGTEQPTRRLEVTKEMFSLPERYQRFAKLYTWPYSRIELTDNDGRTVDVRIEDTGEITYSLITSVAFPLLDMRVLFNGIGGSGSVSYSWRSLTGTDSMIDIGADDWGSIKFDWPIPTFALHMDGETAYNLRHDGDMRNARIDALTGYHASMREANCVENNANALANTAEANADANADTIVANNANSCNAQTANTALTVATNTANTTRANTSSTYAASLANTTAYGHTSTNNALMTAQTAAENEVSIATTANSGKSSIMTGVINGMSASAGLAASSPSAGGAAATIAVSGIVGAISGGIAAETAMNNAIILTQCQATLAGAAAGANRANDTLTANYNTYVTNESNDCKSDQTTNTNNCITSQTANNVAAATANASNTSATMKGNAARTRGTSVSNSGHTQDAAERTAKEILVAAQEKAKNRYENAMNDVPQEFGAITGNPSADYFRTRGVQWKVRTQSDSAIAQAGDTFARYGYALNRMWDVSESGLCPMRNFCFWKASDIWVDCRNATGSDASRRVQQMFLSGVTVWNDPDMIGRVSVYDN